MVMLFWDETLCNLADDTNTFRNCTACPHTPEEHIHHHKHLNRKVRLVHNKQWRKITKYSL
jgi:hypothetical protein